MILGLYKDIGDRLKIIRGDQTQERFVKNLDLIGGFTRSNYSMIEIGKRPASLKLLDMITEQEDVSYDYIFNLVDYRVSIHDVRYHQLLECWSLVSDKDKDLILQYAKRIVKKGNKE